MKRVWLEEIDVQKVVVGHLPDACSACPFLAMLNDYGNEDVTVVCEITDKIIENADVVDSACKLVQA